MDLGSPTPHRNYSRNILSNRILKRSARKPILISPRSLKPAIRAGNEEIIDIAVGSGISPTRLRTRLPAKGSLERSQKPGYQAVPFANY